MNIVSSFIGCQHNLRKNTLENNLKITILILKKDNYIIGDICYLNQKKFPSKPQTQNSVELNFDHF